LFYFRRKRFACKTVLREERKLLKRYAWLYSHLPNSEAESLFLKELYDLENDSYKDRKNRLETRLNVLATMTGIMVALIGALSPFIFEKYDWKEQPLSAAFFGGAFSFFILCFIRRIHIHRMKNDYDESEVSAILKLHNRKDVVASRKFLYLKKIMDVSLNKIRLLQVANRVRALYPYIIVALLLTYLSICVILLTGKRVSSDSKPEKPPGENSI
jgi:cytochrome c biogenesis factor